MKEQDKQGYIKIDKSIPYKFGYGTPLTYKFGRSFGYGTPINRHLFGFHEIDDRDALENDEQEGDRRQPERD